MRTLRAFWLRLWRWSQVAAGNVQATRFGWWRARAVPRSEGVRFGMDEPAVAANGKLEPRIARVDYLDELPSDEEAERDDELRELVDALPATQRHLVSRVYFGGDPLRTAANETNVSIAVAERLLREALEKMKSWLEADRRPSAGGQRRSGPRTDAKRCGTTTRWGRCAQPAVGAAGMCAAHEEWGREGIIPDENYHRRVVLGEVEPIQAKLSATEISATMNGRYRGDGRRLDAYVTHERAGEDEQP